jgi:hypothetical protein
MWLGQARIVGAACRWDPSSGKLKSDVSSLAVLLQDEQGRRYWHRSVELRGRVAVTDEAGKAITGGQVLQIVQIVRELRLPRVTVETNGVGTFAPDWLLMALKQARVQCGVTPLTQSANKNKRILEAIEGPLNSGQLWAHSSVIDGPAYAQMRDWNPAIANQPDDHLDSLGGAISETPERIRSASPPEISGEPRGDDWRPNSGVYEVLTA